MVTLILNYLFKITQSHHDDAELLYNIFKFSIKL